MKNFKKIVIFMMILLTFTFLLPNISGQNQVNAKKKITLNYTKYKIKVGYSFRLKVRGTKKKVKWSSSKKKIATVTKNGKVKAKKAGKCVITAKVGKKKYKCKVTVKKNPKTEALKKIKNFKGVTLNLTSLTLDVNTVTYDKKGVPKLADRQGEYTLSLLNNSKQVTWKTSNANVATVTNGNVVAVSAGTCTVSAVVGNQSYKCDVKVTNLNNAEDIAKQINVYTMLGMVNKDRVKRKVAPLKLESDISKVAELRAFEQTKSYSHSRPDGRKFSTAYKDAGVQVSPYGYHGEVIARYTDHADLASTFLNGAYKKLYDDKPHRDVMLSDQYNCVGIGYYFEKSKEHGPVYQMRSNWVIELALR